MNILSNGEFLVILSTLAFGSMGVLAKGLYNSGVNVATTLTIRFIIASISLFIYMKYKKINFRLTSRELLLTLILGIGGYTTFSFLYFLAIEHIGASIAALIFSIFPVYVCIISKIFFKKNIGIKKIFFLLLSLVALYLLTSISGNINAKGVLLSLFGALCYAVYTMLIDNKEIKNINPIKVSFYIIFFTALFNLIFWGILGKISLNIGATNYLRLLTLGIFSTSIAILSYYLGVQKIGAIKASIISNLEALIAALLAFIFLKESLNTLQIIGATLMIISVVGVSLSKE